jgi:hypothetical protein
MRRRLACLKAGATLFGAPTVILALTPSSARAHVKWFAPYDVSSTPVSLSAALNGSFAELGVFALFLMWVFCRIERVEFGAAILDSVESVFSGLRDRTEALIRAGTAAFYIAIWATGGIILTPELKTSSEVVNWLQALIAVCTFWRATLPISALGIFTLFGVGLWDYGLFHMMDYPIFLGGAIYLAMIGFRIEQIGGLRPVDVVRWGAAVTLMWASVEKWAYPNWSFPVLGAHPHLTLGLDPHFYMTAAGMVEFTLSFALLWTPLVRRLSAVVLLAMFTSAVLQFGKIDAIGHMLIIVLLLAIAADEQPFIRRSPALVPIWFVASLGTTILAYYLAHAALFGTTVI